MANFIQRVSPYTYLISKNSPLYPTATWLKNPDLSGVSGVEQRYWKVVADTVVEMNQTEKDAVDAAIQDALEIVLEANAVSNAIVTNPHTVSSEIQTLIEASPVWTDSVSGLKGPINLMQALVNRRELIGDSSNVVGGYSGCTNNRVSNLESLFSKGSWFDQLVFEARYARPNDLLIYYGWLNSFNSATNSWTNELVARDLAHYELLVLGDGIADSTHGDYSNAQTIVARLKVLKPTIKIFGYVDGTLSQSLFEDEVDDWETLGVSGIFIDQAGYDYGTATTNSRSAMNTKIDYIHGQTSAKLVFMNSWNMDHIIGTENDVSYPNTTWNSGVVESNLTNSDWYLLESHPINTDSYDTAGQLGYGTKSDWSSRSIKAIGHRAEYKINLAASGIILDNFTNGQDLFDFGFTAAMMFSLEAYGISDTLYGASSAKGKWWTRPDVSGLGVITWINPSVQVGVDDSDVYWRYTQFGRFMVDFSIASLQDSSIVKW